MVLARTIVNIGNLSVETNISRSRFISRQKENYIMTTSTDIKTREITRIVQGEITIEGGGFQVRRPFPTRQIAATYYIPELA